MTQAIRRACLQIGLICLAVCLVTVATYVMTPRFDPKKEEAAAIIQAKNHPPMPGGETGLRQAIAEARSGVPNYDRAKRARTQLIANLSLLQRAFVAFEGGFPVQTNEDLLMEARQRRKDLAKLGPLHSDTYLGGGAGNGVYLVTFQNGSLRWFISTEKNGALADYDFGPEGIGSPQNFIDNYARIPMRTQLARLATQLAILLAVAALGRWMLRLRL